jgi:hypothetical protein
MLIDKDCTEACTAMPRCTVCGMRKKPRGRDVGLLAANSYCWPDCSGYYEEPRAGHLWPGEWKEELAARQCAKGNHEWKDDECIHCEKER